MRAPTRPSGAVDLRSRLLPFTIRNAAEKRFYRRHWDGHDTAAVTDLAALSTLPTLSKDVYRSEYMLDFDDPGDSHYVSHSTGTTGLLTWRHRSTSEAATVQRLFGAVARAQRQEPPRVAVNISAQFHGMAFPVPSAGISVPVATYADNEMRHCPEMLQATYRVHGHQVRPTALMGTVEETALVAHALEEHGVDARGLALESVTTIGFADAGIARYIESSFGLPLSQRYSLSEVFGGANLDPELGAYRLDPYVIGEVVDEEGRALPPGEVGELTLTELYPLVQMQPLVRYRTGDIVERVEAGDDVAFRFWGRRSACVAARGRWRLGSRHVADILAAAPIAARHTVRPQLTVVGTTEVGDLRFALEPGEPGDHDPEFDLTVSLRHAPGLHPDAATGIADDLEEGLRHLGDGSPVSMRLRFEHAGATGDHLQRTIGAR